MIWLALFSLYCFLCAAWALCEARERAELRRTIQWIAGALLLCQIAAGDES